MAARKPARGRRTKLTPEVQERIVSAIRAGNYAQVAAQYAGVAERTFYRWLQRGRKASRGRYRDFADAVQQAEREAEVRTVAILHKHMEKHWQAAMTFLERKYPERWGRKDRLTVEVEPKQALSELLSMSDEDLDAAVDLVASR